MGTIARIANLSAVYSARNWMGWYTKIGFYIIISATCRGAISVAEMKPVEPEEASTSVGNKRVLNQVYTHKAY